jgi:hypothetical protein
VTINRLDFRRLAQLSILHPGVIIIPSGGGRNEQFDYIMTSVNWAVSLNYPMSAFANRYVEVSVTFDLVIEDLTMLGSVSTNEQKYLN